MSMIVSGARAIMSLIQPQTGTRGTGTATFTATGADVELPFSQHLIPSVGGSLRSDLPFRLAKPSTGKTYTVTSAGVQLPIFSLLGGLRHNLAAGTLLRLDPAVSGVNPTATVDAAIVDGANPTFFGGVKSVVMAEDMGSQAANLEAFRAKLGGVPGVVITWTRSEPASGSTISGLDRGGSRAGGTRQLFKEHFDLYVYVDRSDGDHARRLEGTEILDELTGWLFDRVAVDGCPVSTPDGVQVLERRKVLGPQLLFRHFYVYLLSVALTRPYEKRDLRTFADWLKTRLQATVDDELTHDPDAPITLVDETFDMS